MSWVTKKRLRLSLLAGGVLATACVASSGCGAGYVLKSGYFQAELLLSREPLDEVRGTGRLSPEQEAQLDLVADVKDFGGRIGLEATENYETIALKWERRIWNLSACDPVSFTPATWWFPIVGRVPYLGYFREEDARRVEEELTQGGYDVHVRTAGAYSTLGWFRDPILPPMLEWSEGDLADTVLHEMTHATLWVPGSVTFNESFANFVGEAASLRYLVERDGPHGDGIVEAVSRQRDRRLWRDLLRALYSDLDAVYSDPTTSRDEKLTAKARLFQEVPDRIATYGFSRPERYRRAASRATWNNARLVQFRTYNSRREAFAAILDCVGGDIAAFIQEVGALTEGAEDPFEALQTALEVQES